MNKELSLKQKIIDYKILDYFFETNEQVHHPKIFFLFNFYKETNYLIKKAKYSRPHYSEFFAQLLSNIFISKLDEIFNDDLEQDFYSSFPVSEKNLEIYISYTPMHLDKEKQRAFNFAYELAKAFSENLKSRLLENPKILLQTDQGLKFHRLSSIEFLKDLFIRKRNTKALFDLKPEERILEIKNAFALNENYVFGKESLKLLLIIDDICTTGSTLMELMRLARSEDKFYTLVALTAYGRNLKN